MNDEIQVLAAKQASLCGIFGNPRRVLIAWALNEREMTVSEIAETLEISLQNTSQHLRLMKDKGLLTSRRDGNSVFYQIVESEFAIACPILLQSQYSNLSR